MVILGWGLRVITGWPRRGWGGRWSRSRCFRGGRWGGHGRQYPAEHNGQLIYILTTDAPGVIGALGTKLGENKINIATFNLGRHEAGGEAVALVSVDDPITPQVANELHAVPGVREVVPLSF